MSTLAVGANTNNAKNNKKIGNKIVKTLSLYSDECIALLKQALETADATTSSSPADFPSRLSKYDSSSEDEEVEKLEAGNGDGYQSSSSSGEDSTRGAPPPNSKTTTKKPISTDQKQKQRQHVVQKHVETLSCASFPLTTTTNDNSQSSETRTVLQLQVPLSLISKEERQSLSVCRSLLSLATALREDAQATIVILTLQSGRFAGAVYLNSNCVAHRTSTRYTVRKGQGKAQSNQDGQRRPKSTGAQLRRLGEIQLQQDVTDTLHEWRHYIAKSQLVLLSAPKTMKKALFEISAQGILSRNDARIHRVPLDLGKPSFENVQIIHSVMTSVTVVEVVVQQQLQQQQQQQNDSPVPALWSEIETQGDKNTTTTTKEPAAAAAVSRRAEPVIELSALHVAAAKGDVDALLALLLESSLPSETMDQQVNALAGELLMTPLHYAAAAGAPQPTTTAGDELVQTATGIDVVDDDDANNKDDAAAADCVYHLLTKGRANPCLVDARNRPPYFLAASSRVRRAFRRARADLGEDYCEWDCLAKVPPALSLDDEQLQKEKEAEKKRRKRERQKEKKQKDKAQANELERQKQQQEEKRKQEEDAKRIRDGLQPKTKSTSCSNKNVCDYCQTVCKGKRRNQMFQRLDYAYCSTDCVNKHKRELMASAALARFGG